MNAGKWEGTVKTHGLNGSVYESEFIDDKPAGKFTLIDGGTQGRKLATLLNFPVYSQFEGGWPEEAVEWMLNDLNVGLTSSVFFGALAPFETGLIKETIDVFQRNITRLGLTKQVIQQISQGVGPVVINGGTERHEMEFVVEGNNLYICNRGAGLTYAEGSKTRCQSVLHFKINGKREETLPQILRIIDRASRLGAESRKSIQDLIFKPLSKYVTPVKKTDETSPFMNLVQQIQREGNCWYMSVKTAVLGPVNTIGEPQQLAQNI